MAATGGDTAGAPAAEFDAPDVAIRETSHVHQAAAVRPGFARRPARCRPGRQTAGEWARRRRAHRAATARLRAANRISRLSGVQAGFPAPASASAHRLAVGNHADFQGQAVKLAAERRGSRRKTNERPSGDIAGSSSAHGPSAGTSTAVSRRCRENHEHASGCHRLGIAGEQARGIRTPGERRSAGSAAPGWMSADLALGSAKRRNQPHFARACRPASRRRNAIVRPSGDQLGL